ncbi:MAG TPA: polyprenyl diphosphate synthase [Terriglobales bacterium]|jgi:undecaprenyl diphosphate synthase
MAIIMDGNGRWAKARGWPRGAGHQAGVSAVRRVVKAAPRCGVGVLTLYAFSSDNWSRPAAEVAGILGLLQFYLRQESAALAAAGVRCGFIGRRDRLPRTLVEAMVTTESETAGGQELWLRLAIDYSSRAEIERGGGAVMAGAPQVDLLLRTGGEQRLSDFLLWESAYAELIFTKVPWPEFSGRHLRRALARFGRRQRRFGGLQATSAAGAGLR